MDFKLDTGADVTVIPPSLYQSLKPTPLLSKTTKLLTGPCKQKLNCLGTFTAELQVQDNVTTEQVYVIPDLKRELLGTGVISKVDQPTDWCAPMVVTPKSNGKVRICVDLSKLNEHVKRGNHPLLAVDTALGRLAGSRIFTKLDANSEFWQQKAAWESTPLTTFITPWGLFCFNVLPFGISSGSEKFQNNMNQILQGLEGVECNIDDVLVHGKDQEQHNSRLEAVLKRLEDAGVKLNLEKCQFTTHRVNFLGHIISSQSIEPFPAW